MSLILDALRRAESERQRGGVPGLHDQAPMDPPPEHIAPSWAPAGAGGGVRRPLAWVLAAAVVVAVAALSWWRWPGQPPAAVPPQASLPQASVAAPPAVGPQPAVPAVVPVAPAAPAPAATAAPVAVPVPMPTVAAPVTAVPRAQLPSAQPPSAQPAAPVVANTASAAQRLPTLAELPEALRRELPALALGGVMYAEQPALRMVIINGQLFHEGDKPAAELQVMQIRHKSVVFGVRGTRFEMAL